MVITRKWTITWNVVHFWHIDMEESKVEEVKLVKLWYNDIIRWIGWNFITSQWNAVYIKIKFIHNTWVADTFTQTKDVTNLCNRCVHT